MEEKPCQNNVQDVGEAVIGIVHALSKIDSIMASINYQYLLFLRET